MRRRRTRGRQQLEARQQPVQAAERALKARQHGGQDRGGGALGDDGVDLRLRRRLSQPLGGHRRAGGAQHLLDLVGDGMRLADVIGACQGEAAVLTFVGFYVQT